MKASEVTAEQLMAQAGITPNGQARDDDGPDLLAGFRDGEWLDQQVFAPLQWVIPGLVPEGVTVTVGAPKVGKSWLVTAQALALASGGQVLGKIAVGDRRPVLYLALEDSDRRMQSRCRQLMAGQPIPKLFLYGLRCAPKDIVATVRQFIFLHEARKPAVIIDTLGKVMPMAAPGETTYQRDYRIMSQFKAVTDEISGSAVIINHHDRKATTEDFVDAVSGTNGIAGSADTILVIRRKRGEEQGTISVTGRDVAENSYGVRFDGSEWRLDGLDLDEAAEIAATREAVTGLGDRSLEIMRVIQVNPAGVAPKDISAKTGIPVSQVYVYCKRLADAQRAFQPSRGLYAPVSVS